MLVGSAGYVLAPAAWVVMAARIVHGLGMSCCSICMSTWIAGLLPKENTGAGMGLYGATNALGQAVAPAWALRSTGTLAIGWFSSSARRWRWACSL